MTPELENRLYNKYPELFARRKLSMDKTSMCYGICCNDGWYCLIDYCCQSLMNYYESNEIEVIPFDQIKEKFGALTIYPHFKKNLTSHYTITRNIISLYEGLSMFICKDCGLAARRRVVGWRTVTSCNKCYRKSIKLFRKKVK